jgi:hypothetical protein
MYATSNQITIAFLLVAGTAIMLTVNSLRDSSQHSYLENRWDRQYYENDKMQRHTHAITPGRSTTERPMTDGSYLSGAWF